MQLKMKEPEIVKLLKEEEKLGILKGKSHYSYENLEVIEKSKDTSNNDDFLVENDIRNFLISYIF